MNEPTTFVHHGHKLGHRAREAKPHIFIPVSTDDSAPYRSGMQLLHQSSMSVSSFLIASSKAPLLNAPSLVALTSTALMAAPRHPDSSSNDETPTTTNAFFSPRTSSLIFMSLG